MLVLEEKEMLCIYVESEERECRRNTPKWFNTQKALAFSHYILFVLLMCLHPDTFDILCDGNCPMTRRSVLSRYLWVLLVHCYSPLSQDAGKCYVAVASHSLVVKRHLPASAAWKRISMET